MMLHCRMRGHVRPALVVVVLATLAACSGRDGYPSLAEVPERPRSPFSEADRRLLESSLEADLERARRRETEPFAASSVIEPLEVGRRVAARPAAAVPARAPAATVRAPRRNGTGGLVDFLSEMADDDPTGRVQPGDVDRPVDALPGPLAP